MRPIEAAADASPQRARRAIDGALGAQYLQAFSALIARPIQLLL